MSRRQPIQAERPDLRRRAESMLGKMIEKVVPSLAAENVEALVHELRVHQIELQMQCEELRRARQEAEEDRERYYQLYETAPGAYISLDPQLRIEQINRAGERLLGLERAALMGQRLATFLGETAAWSSCTRAGRSSAQASKSHVKPACNRAISPEPSCLKFALSARMRTIVTCALPPLTSPSASRPRTG